MNFITANLRLKMVALGLAILGWTGVVYAANPPETETVYIAVPQQGELIPPQFVLSRPIDPIPIVISGNRTSLQAFTGSDIEIVVDYHRITHPGEQSIPVQKVVNTDPDVIVSSYPASVEASVDSVDSALVPVQLVLSPPPPSGYIVQAQTVSPTTVTVTGPHHELTGLTARASLNLSNEKTNVDSDVTVEVFAASGQRITDVAVTPATVRVSLTIGTTVTSRASAVVPVTTGSVAAGYQLVGISVSPPEVALTGPRDILNALDSVGTAPINLGGMTGDTTVTVGVVAKPGVTTAPNSVVVKLHVVPIAGGTPTPAPSPSPT